MGSRTEFVLRFFKVPVLETLRVRGTAHSVEVVSEATVS